MFNNLLKKFYAAYILLTADDKALSAQSPRRFAASWLELMILSILWGILSVNVWSWTWGLFGDYSGIPLIPAAAVLAVGVLLLYRRSVAALAELIGGEGHGAAVTGSLIIAVTAMCLLGLKSWNPDWASAPWHLIRPRTMFRALLLAPVWGAWAMIVTCQFRKPSEATEPAVAAFARTAGPLVASACLAIVLTVTVLYFNYLPWTQLSISAAAMATAVLGGILLTARQGALTRKVLLAVNMLTQIGFFLAYLANR